MISQKSIQQVIDTSQVDDVIQDYVNLRNRGVNMIGLCPFHDEKTPSFTVSPAKNIYKCFGCGKGGGPVQFLMEHDQLSFPEAIKALAKRYNIELEETNQLNHEEIKEKQLVDSLMIVNEYALSYYEDLLWNSDAGKSIGLSYFKERGFRENIIKKFQLGYAKNSYDGFTKTAINKKYNIEHLRAVGLTSRKDLDFFRDRVMFTISNVSGKPIAFAGRSLTTDKKSPKYINSPESPLYNKRKILYGIHLAKASIRKQDVCYLVEGYTDVISLHQGGIENVVASSGTSLTEGQVRLVKRYSDNITLLYDGDQAGINAALRGMDIILSQDMNVKLVILPENEDPDSFMRSAGKSGFEEYIKANEKDFLFFKTEKILEESKGDPIKKASLLRDIIDSISRIRDSLKRTFYIKECGKQLDISEQILVAEVNKQIQEDILRRKRQDRVKKIREEAKTPNPRQSKPSQNHSPRKSEATSMPEEAPFPSEASSDGAMPPLPDLDPGFPTIEEENSWVTEDHRDRPKQLKPRQSSDEINEKDLARIALTKGNAIMMIEDDNGDEEAYVAHYIYSSIFEIIDYFENEVYKQIIVEANEIAGKEQSKSVYWVNHKNQAIAGLAIEFMAQKYHYANWKEKDVFLQSQMDPEDNFGKESVQAISHFKYRKIKVILGQLKERIKTQTLEGLDDELTISLKAYNVLQEERKTIAKTLGIIVG